MVLGAAPLGGVSRPYTISLAGDHLHSKGSLMAGVWVGCFPAGLLYGCWVWWTVLKAVTAGEQGAGRAVRVLGTLLALLLGPLLLLVLIPRH